MTATNDKSFIARFIARSLVSRQEPAQRWEGLLFACLLACGADGSLPAVSSSPASSLSVSTLPTASSSAGSPLVAPSAEVTPRSIPSTRRYVVAAMGDSLTDPKSQGGKYLERLGELCPKSSFKSFGVGGNMVNMMRKRFVRDLYSPHEDGTIPSYTDVIILGGLGDILSNETAKRTAKLIGEDVLLMVNEAKARGARTIVLQLPPWGGMKAFDPARAQMTWDVSKWIVTQVAAQTIDATMDLRPLLSCGNAEVLCDGLGWKDGIHWGKKGHQVVGEALHRALFADCE